MQLNRLDAYLEPMDTATVAGIKGVALVVDGRPLADLAGDVERAEIRAGSGTTKRSDRSFSTGRHTKSSSRPSIGPTQESLPAGGEPGPMFWRPAVLCHPRPRLAP